jgi:Undecaprenyl-phosphate glucose phosphotransferase
MLKRYNNVFVAFLMIIDGIILWLSWVGAYEMRFSIFPGDLVKGLPEFSMYLSFSVLMVAICLVSLHARGLYLSARTHKLSWEARRLAEGLLLAIILLGTVTFFYRGYSLSRGVIAYFFGISFVSLTTFRIGVRLFMRYMRAKGFNLRFILIVGAGSSGLELASKIENHPNLGIVVVGFIDDGTVGDEPIPGIPILGGIEDLTGVLKNKTVDQVYIALPRHADNDLEHVLWLLSDQVVDVRIVPDFSQFVALNASAEEFDGMPIISLTERPLHGWKRLSKRMFDIVLSFAGLIVLSPLMGIIAVLIKLTSPGPVLYVQERIGYDGHVFRMYKFRSMRDGAESATGAVWATRDDPRRTPLGKVLRHFSLDELPQLWNVLKGDMSFVGPRPEREIFVDTFRKTIPRYMMRHKIKSGLTGWAQVNGLRGESPIEKRTQLDLFYIKHWSFWFDVKILLLTVARLFYDDHAY